MADATDKPKRQEQAKPRVIADFGGRRKIFERRLEPKTTSRSERRNGEDRRSGFDRRSAKNQEECEESFKRNIGQIDDSSSDSLNT